MLLKKELFKRQEAIKELIEKFAVSDQQQLVELLAKHHAIETNQAVISRDLRKLGIAKKNREGHFCYALPAKDPTAEILKLALTGMSYNESLIVIKTQAGLAAFVGDYIDQQQDEEILGCLAGENVVFVSPRSIHTIHNLYEKLCTTLYFTKQEAL